MTESLPDTWASRDLPVLRQLVQYFDNGAHWVDARRIANDLTIEERDVQRAFRNLHRGGLVVYPPRESRRASFEDDQVNDVTGEALRRSGVWPTEETALERILAALEAIAENTDADEDTRTRARRILAGFAGAGRQIGIAVAGAAISGQIPGQ